MNPGNNTSATAAAATAAKDRFSPFVYRFARLVLTRPLWRLYGCEVVGAENLPERGPALLACNHSSNLDPCIIGISYPGVIRWMAKIELWRFPPLGWIIERLGAFKVHRGEADREAIRQARVLLKQGWVVGIFPEGHRVRTGELGEFHPGVGMLSCNAGVPIIPIRVHGNDRIGSGLRLRRPRVRVVVGRPVDCDITGMSRGRAYLEATRRIKEAIEAL